MSRLLWCAKQLQLKTAGSEFSKWRWPISPVLASSYSKDHNIDSILFHNLSSRTLQLSATCWLVEHVCYTPKCWRNYPRVICSIHYLSSAFTLSHKAQFSGPFLFGFAAFGANSKSLQHYYVYSNNNQLSRSLFPKKGGGGCKGIEISLELQVGNKCKFRLWDDISYTV